jgi:hypothetical protein
VFAHDTSFTWYVLVAFYLALSTRIASLDGSMESAHVRWVGALACFHAPGPVAQFGKSWRHRIHLLKLVFDDFHDLLFSDAASSSGKPHSRTLYSLAFRFRLKISSTSARGGVSCMKLFGAFEVWCSLDSSMVKIRRKVVEVTARPDAWVERYSDGLAVAGAPLVAGIIIVGWRTVANHATSRSLTGAYSEAV